MIAPKIAHLTSNHKPFDNRIFKQCRSIAASGYDVTLIVPTDLDRIIDAVRIKAVPRPKSRRSRMLRTVWQIYRDALGEDADIYHFHDPELIPAGLLLRARGKRVVIDLHENVPDQILYKDWIPGTFRKALGAVYERCERAIAGCWSAMVTANEDISVRFYDVSSRVTAVHNYSDLNEFPAKVSFELERYSSGTILHCGGISSRTSIHAVLAATELVSLLNPKLIITGVVESNELFQHATQNPGWRFVDWKGMIPRRDMIDVLKQASLALVLYGPADNHLSIRSNRFFEAMAAGLPLIAPDYPDWKQTVEDIGCGVVVNPKDPEAIARAMTFLITNPKEASAMGRRGRHAVLSKFNWTSELPKLLRVYEEVLNKPASARSAFPRNRSELTMARASLGTGKFEKPD